MKRFVSLFVQALNGYLLVASLLVSCTHIQLPHGVYPEDESLSQPPQGAALPKTKTATLPPSKGASDTPEDLASPDNISRVQYGTASWYGRRFHGRLTASGETYDMYEVTAAHRTAPLGTYALVTNLANGQIVQVRINDRGPFIRRRILDLSYGAARELGMVTAGVTRVKVEFLTTEATATVAPAAIAPLVVASTALMPITRGTPPQTPVSSYAILPVSTRLHEPRQRDVTQTVTALLATAQRAGPDNHGLTRWQERRSTWSSRAALELNALRDIKVRDALATIAVARSPGMLYSHGTG